MTCHMVQLVFLLSLPFAAEAQTFSAFLSRVNGVPDSQRAAIVDSFMNAVPGFPYVEQDTLVHYIYRGAANSVTVPGDANSWNPGAYGMIHISGTDFWYHTRRFESDARLDYKFVINGSNWILDPRNPFQVSGGFGPNSELRMPAWVSPPEIEFYSDIPHGTLRDTLFFSSNLGNSRTVRVYLPPGYDSGTGTYPTVLVHDGLEYVTLARMERVLDYLIAHERIQPVIAVFVPPVNRTPEYAGEQQDEFTAFVVSELLPYIDSRYRTRTDPGSRATLGASNGGNIALHLGVAHPEVFGHVAAQSPNVQSHISTALATGPMLALRFYVDLGTYDIPVLIPLARGLRDILVARGYEHRYVEFHEGHSWGNWRAHIDNALELFFPGDSAAPADPRVIPGSPLLLANYPNPFNSATTLSFTLPAAAHVTLAVYDLTGRHVDTLLSGLTTAGSHEVRFDARALPSGIYFCRLQTDRHTMVRKMLLMK